MFFFSFFFLVLISSCFSVVCCVVAPFPYNGQIKRCTYKSKLSYVVLFWLTDFVVGSDLIEILQTQIQVINGNITCTLVFNFKKIFFYVFLLKKKRKEILTVPGRYFEILHIVQKRFLIQKYTSLFPCWANDLNSRYICAGRRNTNINQVLCHL